MIRLVHHLRGRARFEVAGLRRSESHARHLEEGLLRVPGITRASASPVTGRVLVSFAEHETAENIASLIQEIQKTFPETGSYEELRDDAGASEGAGPFEGGRGREAESPRPWERWAARRLVAGPAWHIMDPKSVADHLGTSLSEGLSAASVREHRVRFGSNALPGMESRSFTEILKNQAASLPVALTGVAAGLTILTGALLEGLVILGVAAVNLAVGAVTEHRAEGELQTARRSVELRARVLRDGRIEEIGFDEVVKGDVLSLQPGARIPADARVIRARSLALDEASLTGESMPVNKTRAVMSLEDAPVTERFNMVYRGTLVVEGTGRAVVVAVGQDTVLGRLQRFLWEVFPPEALMARDLRRIGLQIIRTAAAGCGVLAMVSLLRGNGLLRALADAVSLFTGSIPTGLSTLAIGAFALGHRELRQNRILVRRLRALGNLASIQVMCFDKTGTLTHNRMTVRELRVGGRHVQVEKHGLRAEDGQCLAPIPSDITWLIQLSALCNLAHTAGVKDQRSMERSATEHSLIELAECAGLDVFSLRTEHPILEVEHRSDDHPYMVTIHQWGERELLRAVKGSPQDVLDRCSRYLKNGEALPLGEDERDGIELENLRMSGAGLRVLGVACSMESYVDGDIRPAESTAYTWVGLVGLEDPLREEAKPLIRALQRAGVRTVVITGDQTFTAQHIGSELGLSGDEPLRILDSSDLRSMDATGTRAIATKAHVFARLNPTQKLQVVQAFQNAGMSVAMVGDGVNDVLALKVADVGIAMGRQGSALVRRSADLVLEDDSLESVMFAVATGRGFYRNMHRSVRFLLTATHMELLMGISEKGLSLGNGHGPAQALWSNLMCLSLAVDPPRLCRTDEGPVSPEEALLRSGDTEETFLDAAKLMGAALIPAAWGVLRYGPGREAGRLFMQGASINQILYGIPCRRKEGDLGVGRPPNRLLDWTLVGLAGSQFLAIMLPGIGKPLGQGVLRLLDVIALGASGLVALALTDRTGSGLESDAPQGVISGEGPEPVTP